MNDMERIIEKLATMPVEPLGAALCTQAGLLAAKEALRHLSTEMLDNDTFLTRWSTAALAHHEGICLESLSTCQWRLEANSASIGASSNEPDLLLLPLTMLARPDVPVCLPIFGSLSDSGMIHVHGPSLSGLAHCSHDRLIWKTMRLNDAVLLKPSPNTSCWYSLALASQVQLGLAVMQILARRALRTAIGFLDQRILYGQMASTLPQVKHSLAEIELRLLLAETALQKARDSVAQTTCAVHARIKHLTESAIALTGVLLGARGFMREGAEAEFQALQQTAQAIGLAFADDYEEKSLDHCWPLDQLWEALDLPNGLCIRMWRDDELDPSSPVTELLTMQRHRMSSTPRPSTNEN